MDFPDEEGLLSCLLSHRTHSPNPGLWARTPGWGLTGLAVRQSQPFTGPANLLAAQASGLGCPGLQDHCVDGELGLKGNEFLRTPQSGPSHAAPLPRQRRATGSHTHLPPEEGVSAAALSKTRAFQATGHEDAGPKTAVDFISKRVTRMTHVALGFWLAGCHLASAARSLCSPRTWS